VDSADQEQNTGNPPAKKFAKRPTYKHPITVTGQAIDEQGKPIPDAKIYMASKLVAWRRIVSTTTDANGRYEFRDVELPIDTAKSELDQDKGAFEVFGEASGYGFAWRPTKRFYPQGQPNGQPEPGIDDPAGFKATDQIALDLKFPPPSQLSGRIVDELGKPIANTRLTIRYCSTTPAAGYGPGREFKVMKPANELESMNDEDSVPPSMRMRTTDADGRFNFTQLPKDCRFRIAISPEHFAGRGIWAATRDDLRDDNGNAILSGDFVVEFFHPRDVLVQVVYGDTGQPARKVLVQGDSVGAHWSETSDDEGRVTLHLPPGEYRLQLVPERGTPYLVTDTDFLVAASASEPIIARLRAAAVVEITVVDADTGTGVPDVDVWREVKVPANQNKPAQTYRETPYFRSWEVATRIAHVDRPRTDENGKLRMLFEARPQRIGVANKWQPRGYEVVEQDGREIVCSAGETVQVTFHLRKRPAKGVLPAAAGANSR
jgi:hypothetical protein